MKIWGELLLATQRSKFVKKFGKIFEQRRKPKNTEIYHVVSTYSEQVLAHHYASSSWYKIRV